MSVVRAVPVSYEPSPEPVRASRDITAGVRHEGLARVLRSLEGSVFGTVAALERERYGTVSAAEAERYGS